MAAGKLVERDMDAVLLIAMKIRYLFLVFAILFCGINKIHAASDYTVDKIESLFTAILLYQADRVELLLSRYPEWLRDETRYKVMCEMRTLDECFALIREEHTCEQLPDHYVINGSGDFIYEKRDLSRSIFFDSIFCREDFGRQKGNTIRTIWMKEKAVRSAEESEILATFMAQLSVNYRRITSAINATRAGVGAGSGDDVLTSDRSAAESSPG